MKQDAVQPVDAGFSENFNQQSTSGGKKKETRRATNSCATVRDNNPLHCSSMWTNMVLKTREDAPSATWIIY